MRQVKLKDIKAGEMFWRKETSGKVYLRGDYCRYEKRYMCDDWDDISRCIWLKGETIVWIDLTF
jgi:hypothetical protein